MELGGSFIVNAEGKPAPMLLLEVVVIFNRERREEVMVGSEVVQRVQILSL